MKGPEQNNVSQNNNSVSNGDIAGRDINKNVYNQNGTIFNIQIPQPNSYSDLVASLQKATGLPTEFIRTVIQNGRDIISVQDGIALLNISKDSEVISFFGAGMDLRKEYEALLLSDANSDMDEKYFQGIIQAAASSIKKLDFEAAHKLFVSALERTDTRHDIFGLLYKEYLITGFIHYSRRNDMNGLNALLRKERPFASITDPTIDYIIGNIFQEVCSRGTDVADVDKAAKALEKTYKTSPVAKPLMANSLGLAFRRLGERIGIEYLEKAIVYFNEGLHYVSNKTMEVELKDQKAITLIRIFEAKQDVFYLEQAEKLLNECLILLKNINDPRDRKLMPRVLNNLGNIYKQRTIVFEDVTAASKAVGYYTEANSIWTEKDFSYEWGVAKKNIGETKLALGKITSSSQLYNETIIACMASMTYRDLINSPYQWAKAAELIFEAVLLLRDINSMQTIPSSTKLKIRLFAEQTVSYKNGWDEKVFKKFKKNATTVIEIM